MKYRRIIAAVAFAATALALAASAAWAQPVPASMSANPPLPPVCLTKTPCGVAFTTSNWVETTYSVTFDAQGNPVPGHVVGVRSGAGHNQPYAAQAAQIRQGEDHPSPEPGRRLATIADTSGCKQVDWYESGHSSLFGSLVYRFHQVKYWCWVYPRITGVNVYTYVSNVDGNYQYRGVIASSGYYYTWSGSASGGHYSFRQGKFDNCILKYGCISSSYPWVKIYVNGNGAWVGYDGGGA